MRSAICVVYVERWGDRLYFGERKGIAQCYFEHVSVNGETKSISV